MAMNGYNGVKIMKMNGCNSVRTMTMERCNGVRTVTMDRCNFVGSMTVVTHTRRRTLGAGTLRRLFIDSAGVM